MSIPALTPALVMASPSPMNRWSSYTATRIEILERLTTVNAGQGAVRLHTSSTRSSAPAQSWLEDEFPAWVTTHQELGRLDGVGERERAGDGHDESAPPASRTSSPRTESRYAWLAGMAPAIALNPSFFARSAAAMVTMRFRSATRASDTPTASSVPTQSNAATTPCGTKARTRSSSPSPYATGVPPNRRTVS